MSTETLTLLDIVNELSEPIRVEFWIGTHKHTRTDPALLEQLRIAVAGDIGGRGGASKPARERTPIDVGALTLLEEIDGRVRAWLVESGVEHRGDLKVALRRWYGVWTRYPRELSDESRVFAILQGWVGRIRDLVDPPTRQELTARCPECGQMWATRGNGADMESVRALWAVWRVPAEDSEAKCEACGKSWRGVTSMRRLRIALDESDTPEKSAS